MLTSVSTVKAVLGIADTDTTQDKLLGILVTEASAEITRSCNRTHFLITNPTATLTEYYSGNNYAELVLRQWPVYAPMLTGTTTAGSAAITGLASTTGLFAGQAVCCANFPAASYISTIDSSTQVTLTQTATLSGTLLVQFGVCVWNNDSGFWGDAAGAINTTLNQLTEGSDYALKRDMPDGSGSKTAKLFRINGVWQGWYSRDARALSTYSSSGWGNFMVQATYGFSLVPNDLEMACVRMVASLRNSKTYGQMIQSEGYDGYNVQFADLTKALALDKTVARTLARYRIVGAGGAYA